MVDATRYDESLPLIKALATKAKATILLAHLGRPKNNEPEFSFAKIVKQLEKDLGQPVFFATSLADLQHIETGVCLLENVRFFPGEDAKEDTEKAEFLTALSNCADVFVNDAFADYRKSVSTYDIAKNLPSYVGPVFAREIANLAQLAVSATPFVAVLGGAKLSEKLDAMLSLAQTADKVLVGGAMVYTLLRAKGISTGKSRVEEDKIDVAKEIIAKYGDKIILPLDHALVPVFEDPGANIQYSETILDAMISVDIGPKTIDLYKKILADAKTIVWNGPMGVFEREATAVGTKAIGQAIGNNTGAYKVAGGGDSIAAINALGITGFNHISTGGGAMLGVLGADKFATLDVIVK